MIRIQDLCKSYGPQVLFDEASFQLSSGERVGLIGRNGHGKSTLFRLILGEETKDDGVITYPKNYRIGHLAQHIHFTKPTVLEEGCLGLQEDEEHDHYKVERILFGLGFSKEDMDRAPGEFSGGYQIRLNLAKVLVSNPNLLLLDEPTNYLDIVSIRWLTKFLRSWENEMILISHDREFMDAVTTHTALIHREKIRKVEGGTEKIYALISEEEDTYEKTRVNEEKQRKHAEAFINRFKASANRASLVQSRVKMLEKIPQKEKLSSIRNLDFDFHYAPFQTSMMMEICNLTFGFEPETPLVSNLSLQVSAHDRIAVIGKNGKGKSTLLNLLAGEMKPQGGFVKLHANTKVGYFGQTNIQRLNEKLTVEEEIDKANPALGRTRVRGICGVMMFHGDNAEKKISSLSGGEKSRVLLGKILAEPANLLFLDEPTNHLDMQSIEALVDSIESFPGASVIVTHSEDILRRVATKLVVFQHGKAEVFLGTYDEFLEKIGWEEEDDKPKEKKASVSKMTNSLDDGLNPPPTAPPLVRGGGGINPDQSKLLKTIKKEIESVEKDIPKFEAEVKLANEALIEASLNKNIDGFVSLSKNLKESQKKLDERYEKLEVLLAKQDELNKQL